MAAFFSLAASLWGDRERQYWFWGLAVCGAVVGAASFWVEVPGYPKVGVLPPYYNYTVFVETALFSAALAAALRRDGPRGPWRWAAGAFAAFALAHILWACSRGGLVAAACGAGVFAWRHLSRRRFLLPFLALAAALALGGVLALATRAKSDVAQSFKRPQIWKAAVQIALDHPVFGAGPGEFADAFLKHNFPAGYGLGNYRARAEHAHSEVLESAAEFGWPGLILLLAALWAALRPGRPEHSTWPREAALAAFTAMSVQCLADNMLHLPGLGLLYVSALAAAARGPEVDSGLIPGPVWRALALSGLLLASGAWIPGWLVQRWDAAAAGSLDPAARLELLMRAARLAPADPYLREHLARAWLAQGPMRRDAARRQFAEAEKISPFNAVYPATQAELLRRDGAWRQVLEAAGRAKRLEPFYLQPRLLRAEAFLRLGRVAAARAELAGACQVHLFLEPARRAAPQGFAGYEALLFSFDRSRYGELARRAGLDPDCSWRPRSH